MPYEILEDITVLDLSDQLAASFCAKTLGLYGCEVIKIEPPRVGDPTRKWNLSIETESREDDSPLFLHLNSGKKSATLDIATQEGKSVFIEMVKRADVIIESFKPNFLMSLGLSFDGLKEINQSIILTSITPFGQSGPYKDFEYTELTLFALTGAMNREGLPNREPLRYAGEISQYFAGNAAAGATTSALLNRLYTGKGDWIDISIHECMAGHPHQIGRRAPYVYSGELDQREYTRTPSGGIRETYAVGSFRCKDGFVSFLPLGERMWPNIAKMIGREDLIDHPNFKDGDLRTENVKELEAIFQGWLDTKTRQEIFEAVQFAAVPGSPILQPEEVLKNEQFLARGYFQEVPHDIQGHISITGNPFRLPGNIENPISAAPKLGEHTKQVLTRLANLTEDQISNLRKSGIV